MRKGKRQTIERGIYKDARGYEVVAWAGPLRDAHRFPLDTGLKTMRAWRDAAASDLRDDHQPTNDAKTLTGAIAHYKDKIGTKRAPELAALAAWARLYGHLERRKLTPALCVQALEKWKHEGYSQQSLYYRRLVLVKLWQALDGPTVKTPVDAIHISRPKGKKPQWVPDAQILDVLMNLRRQEMSGRLRSAKTRARFLVLVTTGQRPAQLKRTKRGDVVLWRHDVDGIYGCWWVQDAKGGEPIPVYLNREMKDAWEAFIIADAWGAYDTRSFARTLRYAGWPKGIRPYNARHAVGLTLSERGADLRDIASHLGHKSTQTTSTFYVPQLHSRSKKLSNVLDGRFRKSG